MNRLRKTIVTALGALVLCALALIGAACTGNAQVEYSVDIYLASGEGYERSAELSHVGIGTEGEQLTLEAPEVEDYEFDASNAGNVTSLTLSGDSAGNVFKFYYNRKGVVRYDANVPSGAVARGFVPNGTVSNGKSVAAENGYTVEGYRFLGWGKAARGNVDYLPGAEFDVEGDLTLYAIWQEGYTDRFLGTDYIFPDGNKVILLRAGHEFVTENVAGDVFTFEIGDGTNLVGKMYQDGTFAYAQVDGRGNNILEGTYVHYDSYFIRFDDSEGDPFDRTATLTLDRFGEGTHTYRDPVSGQNISDRGFLTYYAISDSVTQYLFTITEGANRESSFVFYLGEQNGEKIFCTTNGEAGEYMGTTSPNGITATTNGYTFILDGYGGATLTYADYTGEWSGHYRITETYDYGADDAYMYAYMYKLELYFQDDPRHVAQTLGFEVIDGYFRILCYTMPLESGNVYVVPNHEAGEYTNGAETLTLDGNRTMFSNGAVYVDGEGRRHVGYYETLWTQEDQLTVVLHEVRSEQDPTVTGTDYRFKIAIEITDTATGAYRIGNTFTVLGAEEGIGYRLLTGTAFGNEYLRISDTPYTADGISASARVAEYGTLALQGGTYVYTKTAEGYVVEGEMGYSLLYRFHRTAAFGADEGNIPSEIVFQRGQTYDSSYFLYDVFYVYSYTYGSGDAARTVKNYAEIEELNGDGVIWYLENINSLYFSGGRVFSGTLDIETDNYFGPFGTFTYVVDSKTGRTAQFYFDIMMDADGRPSRFASLAGPEEVLFEMADGAIDETVHLIIRGREGLYSASGNFNDRDFVEVTVARDGETAAGEQIWKIVDGSGTTLFRYISESIVYSVPGMMAERVTVYYVYNAALANTYSSADGSLTLDGFRNGTYTDAHGNVYDGTYSINPVRDTVIDFRSGNRSFRFDIDGGLSLMDGVFGTYALPTSEGWWDVTFDGHGTATARLGNIRRSGFYTTEGEDCLLFISLEAGVDSYRLHFFSIEGHGECIVYDENLDGVFVSDSWEVLYLDGYGEGVYQDNSGRINIYYELLDRDLGFITIRTQAFTEINLVLDFDAGTFGYPTHVDRMVTYYGEDLSALILDVNGEAHYGGTTGYYLMTEDAAKVFVMNSNAEYVGTMLVGTPGAAVIEDEYGTKYYLWERAVTVTLTGTVEVTAEGFEDVDDKTATLSFTLADDNGDGVVETHDRSARFVVGDETYRVDIINTFNIGRGQQGLALVDWTNYEYSAITEYTYNGNGGGTFRIVISRASEYVLAEGFEEEEGITSTITEEYVGFGPIVLQERRVKEAHLYIGGEYLNFSGPIETVYTYEAEQGPRYNVIFEHEGVKYSVQYNKEDNEAFRLYLVGKYELVAGNDGYSAGVIRHVYHNGGWTMNYADDEFCDVILYKDGAPIVAFSKNVDKQMGGVKNTAWYLALGSYNTSTGFGDIGSIYTLRFTEGVDGFDSVAVEEYTLLQASQPDTSYDTYFANFCERDGEIVGVAAVNVNDTFLTVVSAAKQDADGNVWNITVTDGNEEHTYRATIDRAHTNGDGNVVLTLEEV